MTNITELEIKCLPADLLHKIEVDITPLEDFHSAIHVKDLALPETVEVLDDLERTVATVAAPRVEEEEPEEVAGEGETGEGAEEEGEAGKGAEEKNE